MGMPEIYADFFLLIIIIEMAKSWHWGTRHWLD